VLVSTIHPFRHFRVEASDALTGFPNVAGLVT